MQRHSIAPRANWKSIVEGQGLLWHTTDGKPYWDESAYYSFTLEEIEKIEEATEELQRMFFSAGERIVSSPEMMSLFGIPSYCHDAIASAWTSGLPALHYGRFDFGYTGDGDPKLLEFNCDTPTSMLEAGVVQWNWKEDVFPEHDQFTSLHEKLIARWTLLKDQMPGRRVWFTNIDDESHEDTMTTTYMRDLAEQAGLETHSVIIDQIGIDAHGHFVDDQNRHMSAVFKLYPWEWLLDEEYGPNLIREMPYTAWLEPIWKMVWSNKAVLQVLWDMFPGHPNLLAASDRPDAFNGNFVAKPFLSREGSNVAIVRDNQMVEATSGAYATDRVLYQEIYPLRDFGNGYPVIGSWIVDGEAAGMGIREDGLITGNLARFVPHIIEG